MKKILLIMFALLLLGGANSVKADEGTKTPLRLLKNGVINTTDFDIKPIGTSTLTTDNLYAATFTSKGGYCNTFKYEGLDVSKYDKAVVKYTIEADNGDWEINLPSGSFTALPIGTDQVYEVDLSEVDTYSDFTVFSWNHSGKSITISEVYLYKSSSVEPKNKGFGGEITSLGGITDGTMFVISDNGTKAKYFYTNNENENANVEDVPADAYFYFTLEKYDGDDITGDNIYWIKITNANGEGYPRGTNGDCYLNAVLGFADVVISGPKAGWSNVGNEKKDALWYVTFDKDKGFSFQNVYRAENSTKSWLAIGNNFEADKQYVTLYERIDFGVNTTIDMNVNITVGEETRKYQLYVPANVDEDCPLVISLHGANGASTDYIPFTREVAAAQGCIVAYPQGKSTHFPIGFGGDATGWTANGEDNFDVEFLKAVIEDVASKYQINRKRIYCCGFSNGGMMTYAMANACSDEIAAFASISGYPINEFHLRHTSSRPVPFLHIHGKNDDFVKYSLMPIIVDEMVARMGANPVPTTTTVGGKYTKSIYGAGDGSFPYVYYEVDGMGHEAFTANTEDGNSALTMWNFFKNYTLDSPSDETLKWAPRIETAGFTPTTHGFTMNDGTTLLSFGGAQYTEANKNVYASLQFESGTYKLCFKSTGASGKTIGVRLEKLTSPNTVVLNTTVNVGDDAKLPFEITDGWGEYQLTMTRPDAGDVISITDLAIVQTEGPDIPVIVYNGFGGEITSLGGITDGTMFVISDNGTKAKYFYTNNENENANVEDVPADAYCYFTLEKYDGDDIAGDNIYWIKITNANGEGYPRGSDGITNYYLNAVLNYVDVVISGTKNGWGGNKKGALWYVTYDAEKGFSFQNVYRADNSSKSWLAIGNNFEADKQYLKLYKSINYVNFNNVGTAIIDKKCLVAEGGLSYDASTGVLTSDGTAGKLVLAFATPVDLKNLFQFNLAQSGSTGDILSRLEFYDEDDALINTWNGLKLGNKGWPSGIDNAATNAFLNHKPVKKMVWPSDAKTENNGKTATITSVEFICKTIACAKAGETVLKSLPWNKIDGSGTATPDWNMNGTSDTYYGNYSGDATHYADLTDYSELRVYCKDNNTGFRCFFINAAGTAVNQIHTSAASWNAEKKYYSLDLSTIEKWNGKVALKAMKAENGGGPGERFVTNIVVYQAPAANAPQYTLTGSGMQLAETVAALADATATCIDATGVTGITTDSEAGRTLLTSANPNCLFLGTTGNGGLANTQNVITSGTCANLVLTDGNYPFKAPAGATATAATYSRSMGNKFGTICLPYAVSSSADVKYYTINELRKDALSLTAVTDLPAGTPAVVEKKVSGTTGITATGAGALAGVETTTGALRLIGTFVPTVISASDYAAIYAISNNEFVKATNTITLNPFRAFFAADSSAAKLRLVVDGEATAIDGLTDSAARVEGIYSVDGARRPSLQRGLNVVKMSNGVTTKVYVK